MNMKIRYMEIYAYIIGLSSTFYILMIRGIPIFYYLAVIGIVIFGIKYTKISKTFAIYIICVLFSSFFNSFWGKYVNTVRFNAVLYLILILFVMQFGQYKKETIYSYIKGFKHSCYIQLIWCIFQYILFHFARLDINTILFKDTLHTVNNASRFLEGDLVLSGLCWHPSNMIPVLLFILTFCSNKIVWLTCLFVAINMKSSTVTLLFIVTFTVKLCIFLSGRFSYKITLKKIVIFVVSLCIIFIVLSTTNIVELISDRVELIFNRIIGIQNDLSTNAHKEYYLLYSYVLKNSSVFEILFGYGLGCSGVPITNITGQYRMMGAWNVETDVMNYVYGIGLIGSAAAYTWFFSLMIKSKYNRTLTIGFIIPILIAGITYNVQYYWVVLFEAVVMICDINKVSILNLNNKKVSVKMKNDRVKEVLVYCKV